MIIFGWTVLVLACVQAWLLVRDLRSGWTYLARLQFNRTTQPFYYWPLMLIWLALFLICGFVGYAFVTVPAECDSDGRCVMTIRVAK